MSHGAQKPTLAYWLFGQTETQSPPELNPVVHEVHVVAEPLQVRHLGSHFSQTFPFKKEPSWQVAVHCPLTIATGHVETH